MARIKACHDFVPKSARALSPSLPDIFPRSTTSMSRTPTSKYGSSSSSSSCGSTSCQGIATRKATRTLAGGEEITDGCAASSVAGGGGGGGGGAGSERKGLCRRTRLRICARAARCIGTWTSCEFSAGGWMGALAGGAMSDAEKGFMEPHRSSSSFLLPPAGIAKYASYITGLGRVL